MANNTMDAIKKKMQAMKLEKENAFDKADQLEQKLNEQKTVFEKVSMTRFLYLPRNLLTSLTVCNYNATQLYLYVKLLSKIYIFRIIRLYLFSNMPKLLSQIIWT